ncbi:TetR/AcrR family transcriptional regulator [Tomitella fengzijianii]|uniref:TetR/AcrR family transcriptional regulator n=1 Tax=Tomitella fengzijianii TaxID=2597660 RepID=A0A516X5C5_9ACTN|nr:TetR/AcrR family transcriptional regulator [Tomitella fengzijianii]QDQ98288.1 TetR/AcrR family transcriptional regulator [Tomitella fengzijianii]
MMRNDDGSGTRQEILGAAAEIIGTYGYFAASVDRIITLAQVAPGELYSQFDSKDALAQEIIAVRDQRAAEVRRAAASSGAPALETLIDESMALAALRDSDVFCLAGDRLLREVDDTWDVVAASRTRDRAEFALLLRDARREGHLAGGSEGQPDAVDAETGGTGTGGREGRAQAQEDALAQVVLAAVIGAGVSARAVRDARDAVTVLERLWLLLLPGLVPEHLRPRYIDAVGRSARLHRRQQLP